jgi:hypothetical protein
MEIITYVREGRDHAQGQPRQRGRTEAGDVQVMSAGTGIEHAEYQPRGRDHADLPDLDHPDQRGGDRAGARARSPRTTAPAGS